MLELTRGDTATILIEHLLDKFGAPDTFTDEDVIRFTASRRYGRPSTEALITKSSEIDLSGITWTPGEDHAQVTIFPADFEDLILGEDLEFVWDCQLSVDGDPTQIVTLERGEGVILADVTLTAP